MHRSITRNDLNYVYTIPSTMMHPVSTQSKNKPKERILTSAMARPRGQGVAPWHMAHTAHWLDPCPATSLELRYIANIVVPNFPVLDQGSRCRPPGGNPGPFLVATSLLSCCLVWNNLRRFPQHLSCSVPQTQTRVLQAYCPFPISRFLIFWRELRRQ